MKKVLVLAALLFLIVITTSCQKPEEVTLSKYFQAMKAKDRDTMAAMAAEPFAVEFKSWKLVSSEPPVYEDSALPKMMEDLAAAKKKKDDQILLVKDKKDALDLKRTELGEAGFKSNLHKCDWVRVPMRKDGVVIVYRDEAQGGTIAANTRSPVILNLKNRKGMQKVLSEVHPALLYRAR